VYLVNKGSPLLRARFPSRNRCGSTSNGACAGYLVAGGGGGQRASRGRLIDIFSTLESIHVSRRDQREGGSGEGGGGTVPGLYGPYGQTSPPPPPPPPPLKHTGPRSSTQPTPSTIPPPMIPIPRNPPPAPRPHSLQSAISVIVIPGLRREPRATFAPRGRFRFLPPRPSLPSLLCPPSPRQPAVGLPWIFVLSTRLSGAYASFHALARAQCDLSEIDWHNKFIRVSRVRRALRR